MSQEKRNLYQEALDLASGKTVKAALPRNRGYRRVSTAWLATVATALDDAEYTRRELEVARRFAPEIAACGDCGNPKASGIRCTYCPPIPPVPASVEHPDWRIEVEWDMDHGWLVLEPREDDGEMETTEPEIDGDRVLKKDAIEWGLEVAKKRQLPLRIYHKQSTRVTEIPLSEIK